MILAPVGTRLLERAGYILPAQIFAYGGYTWLGFIFTVFWLSVVSFAIDVLARLMGLFAHVHLPALSGRTPVLLLLCLAVAICIYGYVDAKKIRVERVQLKTEKLPVGVDRLKIAQISDVHLGLIVRDGRLTSIVEKICSENPDLLVSTGDLVDGDIDSLNGLAHLLRDLQPRYGKFAVTGNHEVIAGLGKSIEVTNAFGFKLLRGRAENVAGVFNIAGVDDPMVGPGVSEADVLTSVRNGLLTVFLKHRPDVEERSKGLFDLQLSGHTHRGQIFPFNFVTGRVYPMQNGLYKLEKGAWLYTSRGSGTWGPPIRVLSPPEVTIIELTRG
jgi:predicted MPP superfamily phosphohydrolase